MGLFGQKNKESNNLISTLPFAFARLKAIVNGSGQTVDLEILNVNNEFEKISGKEMSYLIGNKLSEQFSDFSSKLSDRLNLNTSSHMDNGSFELELFIERISKWFDVFVNATEKDNIVVFFSDSSKRKGIEKSLKESEQKFKDLYENSTIGIYRTSISGKILMANPTLCKALGYSSFEELAKIDIEKEGYGDNFSRKDFIKAIKKNGEVKGFESAWKKRNGEIIFIRESAKAIKDQDGNIVYFEGSVEDINNKKIAEDQISRLNNLYLELGIDPIRNIHTIVNKTSEIFNDKCVLYNQLDDDEKSIITVSECNAPKGLKKIDIPIGHICFECTIKGNEKATVINDLRTTEFLHSDPNVKKYGLISYLGIPVAVDGKAIGSLCVLDIVPKQFTETEIKIITTLGKAISLEVRRQKLENDLKSTTTKAEHADKAKSQFLANMSHEIRTPLNSILGFTEMLILQEKDDNKLRMLNMIENSGSHLFQIINDILEYSKIEAGKLSLKESDFDLKEIIDETIGYFEMALKSKNLKLVVSYDDLKNNLLFGDFFKLKQVLANVIGNAVKFTDEGSIIILVKTTRKKSDVETEIIVEDTGIGISKDQQNQIFDEFKQLEYFLNKKIKGTGIGLSIAKKLLDLLNGGINVESKPGTGSRFIINTPFKIASDIKTKGAMVKPNEINESDTKKLEILLAEDNEANQFLIKAIAKAKNWEIQVVDNGEQAIEEYKKGNFDLILMDVQMPVMNGYEATKIIRELEKESGKHIPIIAMTAYAMQSDRELCIEAGMDDYISKPFKRQQFLETIINLIDK